MPEVKQSKIKFQDKIEGVFNHRNNPWDSGIIREVWGGVYFGDGFEIKEGDNVVDIGSHIGSFSVLAGLLGGNVIAFEPAKKNYDFLTENIKLNNLEDKIRAYNLAITADGRDVHLWTNFEDPTWNTGTINIDQDPRSAKEVTKSKTLDSVCQEHQLYDKGIDFLKMDCEGTEYEILYGATSNIFTTKLISMEFHHSLQEGKLLANFLERRGYKVKLYWSASVHGIIKAKK